MVLYPTEPKLMSMRYFIELSYLGTSFSGWQKQPHAHSIQGELEQVFSTLLKQNTEIIGCGRTDAGVHASYYVAHVDLNTPPPGNFLHRANRFLSPHIALHRMLPVPPDAHARFSAIERSYEYHIHCRKNPFKQNLSYHFPFCHRLAFAKLQEAGRLIMQYEHFYPFCKSNSDARHMRCTLQHICWERSPDGSQLIFSISANRFLRGMVRLIVGASLQIGLGKMTLEELQTALERQSRLPKAWSVPAEGLYLTGVKYPPSLWQP